MVRRAGAVRLYDRTQALGLTWAMLQFMARGATLPDVRRILNAVEKEGR